MTIMRVPAGVPSGGEFAARARGGAPVTLTAGPGRRPMDRMIHLCSTLIPVRDHYDRLVRTQAEPACVMAQARVMTPKLGDATFRSYMAPIVQAADDVATVENDQAGDRVDVLDAIAQRYGVAPYGDGRYSDLDDYRAALADACKDTMFDNVVAMVKSNDLSWR